jgi:hypothetical protein
MPAFAKTTSTPPSASTTSSNSARTSLESETSATNERAFPPRSTSDAVLRSRLGAVDVRERHTRAAVGQHLGHREAEPAGRACHDGPHVADVEEPAEHLHPAIASAPLGCAGWRHLVLLVLSPSVHHTIRARTLRAYDDRAPSEGG